MLTVHFSSSHMLAILFITYEYSESTFSGNGVYAVSQVRALASLGHDVTVVAARPRGSEIVETKATWVRLTFVLSCMASLVRGGWLRDSVTSRLCAARVRRRIVDQYR